MCMDHVRSKTNNIPRDSYENGSTASHEGEITNSLNSDINLSRRKLELDDSSIHSGEEVLQNSKNEIDNVSTEFSTCTGDHFTKNMNKKELETYNHYSRHMLSYHIQSTLDIMTVEHNKNLDKMKDQYFHKLNGWICSNI